MAAIVAPGRPKPVFTCFLLNTCLFLACVVLQKQRFVFRSSDESALIDAVSYSGTLHALQTSLHAAVRRGELRLGVAGGSVSVGAGCPSHGWVNHLEELLRVQLGSSTKLQVFNVAQGATGPDRVFYCLESLLPVYRNLDVIFLEYAINEQGGTMSELLLRRVMVSTPVVFVDTFTLSAGPFRSAQQYHDTLARYYDVPVLSTRDALWHHVTSHAELLKYFSDDETHPSCKGHRFLGSVAAQFLIHVLKRPIQHTIPTRNISSKFPDFLDLSNLRPPESILSSSPRCAFVQEKESVYPGPGWKFHGGYKPYYECDTPEDGNLTIPYKCEETLFDAGCQILLYYTTSWQPLGSAIIFVDGVETLTVNGFSEDFRRSNLRWTVETSNSWDSLRVKSRAGSIQVRCLGISTAPKDMTGAFNRTAFRVHSIVQF